MIRQTNKKKKSKSPKNIDPTASAMYNPKHKASEFQSRRNELGVKIHYGSEAVKSHNRNRDPS